MKSSKRSQNLYRIKVSFADYFSSNRSCIILLSGVFVIGLAVGIFTYIKLKTTLNLSTETLNIKSLFSTDSVFLSFFLWRFIVSFSCLGLIFFLCVKKFTHFLVWIVLGYRGYLLGTVFVTVLMFLGFGSFVGLFLIFLPLEITINFVVVNFSCFCLTECDYSKRFGRRAGGIRQYLDIILLFIFALLILHLAEFWFVPSMIKKIIIFT